MLKEFFVKHAGEKMTHENVSNMLSEDCNNMFMTVRNKTEKNYEAITRIRGAQVSDKNMINDMIARFARLSESIQHIIATNRRENVKWADLDALKQEYITMQDYLSDKIQMHDAAQLGMNLRVNKLEDFCFKGSDKIAKEMYSHFDEFKTEMGYRIKKFTETVEQMRQD